MRITEQVWPEGTVPVVSVRCVTYNHVTFIRDAIDGFLMQETTFPVEILIHDDASTDGTADIVREYEVKYPNLIRTVLQTENQWSKGLEVSRQTRKIFNNMARGEFIALCEGDDYWTHRLKLEKQVALYQSELNILFCGGSCVVLDEESGKVIEVSPPETTATRKIKASNYFPGDSQSPWIHTCTRIFPKRILRSMPDQYGIDTLMLHWLVTKYPTHEIVFVPDVVATYRIHAGGFWSGMDKSTKNKALVDIYSKAAGLHRGRKKNILLTKAIEHAELVADTNQSHTRLALLWALKITYLKVLRIASSLCCKSNSEPNLPKKSVQVI